MPVEAKKDSRPLAQSTKKDQAANFLTPTQSSSELYSFFGSFYFSGHPGRWDDLNGDFFDPHLLLGWYYLEIIESEVKEIWGHRVRSPRNR